MTPAARAQAAIDVLDTCLGGAAAEQALLAWSRRSRFAGSKDRAAVRDLVFDAIRRRRSCGAWPDGSARLWLARLLHQDGADLAEIFTGMRFAPDPLSDDEQDALAAPVGNDANLQDWMLDRLTADFGDRTTAIVKSLDHRASVFLRVNRRNAKVTDVIDALRAEGISAEPVADLAYALRVTDGQRKLAQSKPFADGWFEFQDAASQRAAEAVPITGTILDYCAGGGGKALALADRGAEVFAHDANRKRMHQISDRARRAGVRITRIDPAHLKNTARFDTVFVDAPCSGSGAWRRSPAEKWTLTPADLDTYVSLQREIIETALTHCRPGGTFVYATCSIFRCENQGQIDWLLQGHPEFDLIAQCQQIPGEQGDGFYHALIHKSA